MSPVVKTSPIYWCKQCQTSSFENANCPVCGEETRVTIGWIEQDDERNADKV